MINVFLDGFSNFQSHFWIVISIFLIVIWGQVIIQNFFNFHLTDADKFSLPLAGWIFPVFIFSLIYFLTNILFGKIFGFILSALLLILPFFWIRFKRPPLLVVLLICFLLISIFVRLAFLSQVLLPAYFDSASHYLYIQNILNGYENKTFAIFGSNYYHLAYHFTSAAVIHLFQFNIAQFMLVFGQIILAILPISLFFLLKQMTSSNTVAFFTCLAAGFGFHMPAHAINWGKYPALLSLVGIQFVLCLGYLKYKNNLPPSQNLKLNFLLAVSILITTLIHSRTFFVFAIFLPVFFITMQYKKTSKHFQLIAFVFILLVLGIEIFSIQRSAVLLPLFERYLQKDIWILFLILLLTPFSFKTYPDLTFSLFISLSLFLFALFLPISLLNYNTQTLLDRPFVQMLIYIPLSILIGLGFGGLLQTTQKHVYLKTITSLTAFGFLLINIHFNQDFYPSSCCQLVTQDDLSAITWIKENILTEEKVLIAASQLYVTAYEAPTKAAVDAGIWITPLARKQVLTEFTNIDFTTQETYEMLCTQKVKYIYLGGLPASFNQNQLISQPSWYQPMFLLPKAQIYQVMMCD